MKITIDTTRNKIIVPTSFFKEIDKMNEALKVAGVNDKKIDYTQYVKDSFEKAIAGGIERVGDKSAR